VHRSDKKIGTLKKLDAETPISTVAAKKALKKYQEQIFF
jgi:hypothetical protein